MGCVCCSLSSFVSIVLDALEKISLCTVCTMLTCCLMFTIVTVMMLGIGIGYHYCVVTNSVADMSAAAKTAGALRSGPSARGNVMRSVDKAVKRGVAHRLARRDIDAPAPFNNNTLNEILNRHNITVDNAFLQYNFTTNDDTKLSNTNLTSESVTNLTRSFMS